MTQSILQIMFPSLLGLMASFCIIIGCKGVIRRKPFLFSAQWILGLISLIFISVMMLPFLILYEGKSPTPDLWVISLMFLIIMVFLVYTLRGYLAFGITDLSFQQAIHYALKEMNVKFDENLSSIYLPEKDMTLQLSIQPSVGTAQIKFKNNKDNKTLQEIVAKMNLFFSLNKVQTNMIACFFYILLGLIFISLLIVEF